jgi:chromosome segregation ATPase
VEDDAERSRRQEMDLEARLSHLRHQLMACESELSSGRGRIQSLTEVLEAEQRDVESGANEDGTDAARYRSVRFRDTREPHPNCEDFFTRELA